MLQSGVYLSFLFPKQIITTPRQMLGIQILFLRYFSDCLWERISCIDTGQHSFELTWRLSGEHYERDVLRERTGSVNSVYSCTGTPHTQSAQSTYCMSRAEVEVHYIPIYYADGLELDIVTITSLTLHLPRTYIFHTQQSCLQAAGSSPSKH